jgi:hypothetical protein
MKSILIQGIRDLEELLPKDYTAYYRPSDDEITRFMETCKSHLEKCEDAPHHNFGDLKSDLQLYYDLIHTTTKFYRSNMMEETKTMLNTAELLAKGIERNHAIFSESHNRLYA